MHTCVRPHASYSLRIAIDKQSHHVKTEASQNTTDNVMLAGPLVVMVAVVVITDMTMYNEHG